MADFDLEKIKQALQVISTEPYGPAIQEQITPLLGKVVFDVEYGLENLQEDAGRIAGQVVFDYLKTIEDPAARVAAFEKAQETAKTLAGDTINFDGLPYSDKITANLNSIVASDQFMAADYNSDKFMTDSTNAVTGAFREHVASLPVGERYEAFKQIQTLAGGVLDASASAQVGNFMAKIDAAGPDIQEALAYALANNDSFFNYLMEKAAAGGADGNTFIDTALDSIYQTRDVTVDGVTSKEFLVDENGNRILNGTNAGILQDVLTNIGNNPDEVFDGQLDAIATTTLEFNAANTPEAKQAAKERMVHALRDAGAQINAFATFDMEDLMQFINDLVSGKPAELAIGRLAENLGLEGEQLAVFTERFTPMAKLIDGLTKPYTRVYQDHHVGVAQAFNKLGVDANVIGGNARVQQTATVAETTTAAADPVVPTTETETAAAIVPTEEAPTEDVAALSGSRITELYKDNNFGGNSEGPTQVASLSNAYVTGVNMTFGKDDPEAAVAKHEEVLRRQANMNGGMSLTA